MYLRNLLILSALLFVTACARKQQAVNTPWGETIGDEEGDTAVVAQNFSYNDILDAGEIIMLTMSGPDSYFDYHGRAMGTHRQHVVGGETRQQATCRLVERMVQARAPGSSEKGGTLRFLYSQCAQTCLCSYAERREGRDLIL